ncbi:MAG: hypothetical protein A2636_06685 [Elusimicrobia bacterium RIFCSPHIGHO2_01_FULL_64_10]|nr:MAG: hypothetical protein A2636_06685 [Elusimicrobia bacterium RIFCSPHIGHO2_01_FULL_64_10]
MDKIAEIEKSIRPALAERGFELVEVHYRRESGRQVLRVFIDKNAPAAGARPAGSPVTLMDCEEASKLLGPVLDAGGLVGESYVLEVSSPGINRPLVRQEDFSRHVGLNVRISLHAPLDPETRQRNFSGILLGLEGRAIEVADRVSGRVKIPLESVAKAHLDLI